MNPQQETLWGAPKAASADRRPPGYSRDGQRREQAAARAGAYIEKWFGNPRDAYLERAERALREALEQR